MRQLAYFLGAALIVTSCVPKKKFETLVKERNLIQSKLQNTESKLTETQGELSKANDEARALQGQVGNLEGKVSELSKSLEDEQTKVGALTTSLDQTTDQLAQVSNRQTKLQDQYAKLHQIITDKEKYKTVADARVAEYWLLRSKLGATNHFGKAQAAIEDGKLVVVLPVDNLFVGNSATLSPSGTTTVQEAARALSTMESQPRFVVETHTDSASPAGSGFGSNWELGAARSIAIARAMTTSKGASLAQNRVGAQTFGDTSPRASNESPEGRALNRRAFIVVLPNNTQLPGYAELKSASDAVSTVKYDAAGRAVVSSTDAAAASTSQSSQPAEPEPTPAPPEASSPPPPPPPAPAAAPHPAPPPAPPAPAVRPAPRVTFPSPAQRPTPRPVLAPGKAPVKKAATK